MYAIRSYYAELYREARNISVIKKAFVGSGIRYDYLDHQEEERSNFTQYITEIIKHHVSGRLKIAPEHTSPKVLRLMRKPGVELFEKFSRIFNKVNNESGLKQQLIPYFISSHPDCSEEDMAELAVKTKHMNFRLEQVQDFTPTPMTLATVIYYSVITSYSIHYTKLYEYQYKNSKVKAIRHVVTPGINFSYRPDFSDEIFGFYLRDTAERTGYYNPYINNAIYGVPVV